MVVVVVRKRPCQCCRTRGLNSRSGRGVRGLTSGERHGGGGDGGGVFGLGFLLPPCCCHSHFGARTPPAPPCCCRWRWCVSGLPSSKSKSHFSRFSWNISFSAFASHASAADSGKSRVAAAAAAAAARSPLLLLLGAPRPARGEQPLLLLLLVFLRWLLFLARDVGSADVDGCSDAALAAGAGSMERVMRPTTGA